MKADGENLMRAWQWAAMRPLLNELATGVGGMANYWAYGGLFAEGEEALATAVTHLVPLLPSAERSNLLARLYAERGGLLIWRNLAAVAWRLGDFSMAQEYCSPSLALLPTGR
jgi:hypothetical protein